MATYSLLQVSLDQTVTRESLEEASDVIPSLTRADCVHLQRDLFGIVISNLSLEEATAFQAELKRRDFPTDLVADHELPVLHEPFTIQRIEIKGQALLFTDSMGREQVRTLDDLVFVAGGFLTREKMKVEKSVRLETKQSSEGTFNGFVSHRETTFEKIPEFRLDFFFCAAPNRLRASVSAEGTIFFRSRPLRLRDAALLLGAMMDLVELLPPERVGAGLKRPDTKNYYPSLRSYEEEIRWHFHRLSRRA